MSTDLVSTKAGRHSTTPACAYDAVCFEAGYCHCVRARELEHVSSDAIAPGASVAVEWSARNVAGAAGASVDFQIRRARGGGDAAATLVDVTCRWGALRPMAPPGADTPLAVGAHRAARLHDAVTAVASARSGVAVTSYWASRLSGEAVVQYTVRGRGADLLADARRALRVHQRVLGAYDLAPIRAPFSLPALPDVATLILDSAEADGLRAEAFLPGACLAVDDVPRDPARAWALTEAVVTGDPVHPLAAAIRARIDTRWWAETAPDRVPLRAALDAYADQAAARAAAWVAHWQAKLPELRAHGWEAVVYPPTTGLGTVDLAVCVRLTTRDVGDALRQARAATARYGPEVV